MNKFSWRRNDQSGRTVIAELWIEKGQIEKLRLITHCKVGNEERKFRTDYHNDGSKAFKDAIKKEMKTLKQYVRAIQMLARELDDDSAQPEKDPEGLEYTVQMMKNNQT